MRSRLLAEVPSGRVGEHETLTLFAPATPYHGDWFELTVEGLPSTPLLSFLLIVRSPSGTTEFALAPPSGGVLSTRFETRYPITRIELEASTPKRAYRFSRARLRSITRLGIAQAAFSKSPARTAEAAYWALRGKKVRARNRMRSIICPPPSITYRLWLARQEPLWHPELAALLERSRQAPCFPSITVLIVGRGGEPVAPQTLRSVEEQHDLTADVVVLGCELVSNEAHQTSEVQGATSPGPPNVLHASSLRDAFELAQGDWVLALRNGSQLAAGALHRIAACAVDHPGAAVIYGDHDVADDVDGRRSPQFKPDWNEAYFLAFDYIGEAAFLRQAIVDFSIFNQREARPELDDFVLGIAQGRGAGAIAHIPRILVHASPGAMARWHGRERLAARAQAVARFANNTISSSPVEVSVEPGGGIRVRRAMPSPPPLVSLIVPTRDRVDLLRPCVESLRTSTDYPSLEIIIADNESRARATRAYLDEMSTDSRVRVVACPGPFNFSAINNRAVQAASGAVLGFINNDIEALHPDWLAEMVANAVLPQVGAVGAKLLYAAGNVQHAGVIVGINGLAGHAHRFFDRDHPGYMRRLQVPHYLSAVTAACMVVERSKFEAVGGFDEEAFPVAYNDVDLCLRLRAFGLENLWTPYAVLYHKETASRPRDFSSARRATYEQECANLRTRWAELIAHDPCYSPHLTREREDFTLATI